MRPLDFDKKNNLGCLLSFYKKIQVFSYKHTSKKHGFYINKIKQNSEHFVKQLSVITSQIELTDLAEARNQKSILLSQ